MAGMSDARLFAVVLAAGQGRRFGGSKQLESWRGQALVAHAVRAAEAACGSRSLLITGHDAARVEAAAAPLAGFYLRNENWMNGLGSSLAAGVQALAGTADAVLVMLADQPLVDAVALQRLIDAWRAAPARIAASRYRGVLGVPAIFPASGFAALSELEGDRGARTLIEAAGSSVQVVECDAAAIDIDTPADLTRLPD